MKANDWLTNATEKLKDNGIPTARLDAIILLEDATGKDRAWLLANPGHDINTDLLKLLDSQLKRRSAHEPLAYIRERSEFYGRDFMVTRATLQPRPETETMIELLKTHIAPHFKARPCNVVDVGTGSGAIAITAKLELPGCEVHATDIQPDTIDIARENAKKLKAEVVFYEGDLLAPLKDIRIDIILANLPYVPEKHTINQAAMQEPSIAIFGGEDGLDPYRNMFSQIVKREQKPGFILTESLPFQHSDLQKIAEDSGYSEINREDFIQLFKQA